MNDASTPTPTGLSRWLRDRAQLFYPFTDWIGELRDPEIARADLIAGVSIALVLVPQSMAYAQLAGLPPWIGLYAAFLSPIIAALFGSSRQLQNGPVAIISLMTAAALVPMQLDPVAYIAMAAALALMVGVFQMVLGLLRLGVLVDFLSHPVVIGFTNAAAIVIGSLQLGKLFGIDLDTGVHLYIVIGQLLESIPSDTHWPTLAMGLGSLAGLVVLKRVAPRWPGIVMVVAGATLIAWLTGYREAGGATVGEIPRDLPGLQIPAVDWTRLGELIVPAMIIALLSFVEAFSVAKAIASKTRQRLSADQEMIGKGLANVVAGLFQGYAVSGSFSRTAVAFDAGARTGMTSIISGVIVGITLLFLTPLLFHLPLSTLAAVIIVAVAGLVKFEPFKHAWAVNPHDGWVAFVVFATTLATAPHLETGIFVGVILSLVLYLYRTMQPHFAEVARDDDGVFRDAALYKLTTSETMALYRYDGDLYFANAGYLETRLLDAVADKPALRVLILDIEAVDQIDATGEDMLARISENLDAAQIAFYLTRPKFKVLDALKRSGLYRRIGEKRIFAKRKNAIVAVQKRYGDSVDVSHLITYQPLEDASDDDVPPKPAN
ncbi:MAG: sulfate permease [Pseudomonadota bacterium]